LVHWLRTDIEASDISEYRHLRGIKTISTINLTLQKEDITILYTHTLSISELKEDM
jgi:hypothetical protein